jgi:gephyrin
MSTGDELLDVQANFGESGGLREERDFRGIWDCNRPSLQAALTSLGYEVVDLGIVKDS